MAQLTLPAGPPNLNSSFWKIEECPLNALSYSLQVEAAA
jgi:hypothetical protein